MVSNITDPSGEVLYFKTLSWELFVLLITVYLSLMGMGGIFSGIIVIKHSSPTLSLYFINPSTSTAHHLSFCHLSLSSSSSIFYSSPLTYISGFFSFSSRYACLPSSAPLPFSFIFGFFLLNLPYAGASCIYVWFICGHHFNKHF